MLEMMRKLEVITLYREGESKRAIAKKLGISRQTVTRYVDNYLRDKENLEKCSDPVEMRNIQQRMLSKDKMNTEGRKRRKMTGALLESFLKIMEENDKRNEMLGPNKQEVTGTLVHDELIKMGYDIGETTIRKEIALYKNKKKDVFIKQSYDYGDRMDFDFHQIKLIVRGKKQVYHQVTVSCPKSNYIYVKLYHNEKIESVLSGIKEFFRHCGGVFNEVVFDNLKPVVKVYGYKNEKELTDDILKFSAYYGIKITTCNARKGNEKGHVENSGKNARTELFSLRYQFENEDELNAYVEQQLNELNKGCLAEFEEEKKHLKPLPVKEYLLGRFGTCIVNSYSFVMIEKNYYSVPEENVYKELRYSILNDDVVILNGTKEVARHKKIDGEGCYRVNISHYLETLNQKPGALARSMALKQMDKELIGIYNEYYKEKPKEFIAYLKGRMTKKETDTVIESQSQDQLQQINAIFNLGGNENGIH